MAPTGTRKCPPDAFGAGNFDKANILERAGSSVAGEAERGSMHLMNVTLCSRGQKECNIPFVASRMSRRLGRRLGPVIRMQKSSGVCVMIRRSQAQSTCTRE